MKGMVIYMEKFVPYKKLSKKKQRELNAKKRGGWGGLEPITRRPDNPKAYNRRTAQSWKNDPRFEPPFLPFYWRLVLCNI